MAKTPPRPDPERQRPPRPTPPIATPDPERPTPEREDEDDEEPVGPDRRPPTTARSALPVMVAEVQDTAAFQRMWADSEDHQRGLTR